jgi:hypothetical protein
MENKKHFDVCDKPISKSNWAKHINTKNHRDRVQTTPKHPISTAQIFPPGPITRFPSSRFERRRKINKQLKRERTRFLRELPFFRSNKRARAKRKSPKHKEHINNDNRFRESEEYFDREQGLNELPNDPEIFRPHHSESRDVGPYTIEPIEKRDHKFGLRKSKYGIRLNPEYSETRVSYDTIYKVLSEMVKMFRDRTNFQRGDRFRVIILNEYFSNNGIIPTPYLTIESNEDQEIIEQLISSIAETLVKVITSNETIRLEDCKFEFHIIVIPQGQGRTKITNIERDSVTKRSIRSIKNKDNLCASRAIVVALTYLNQENIVQLGLRDSISVSAAEAIIKGDDGKWAIQRDLAKKLLKMCQIDIPLEDSGLTLEQIQEIEKKIKTQINIVNSQNFNEIIYSGPNYKDKIYLYKRGNHFDVITSITGFYGCVYYCHVRKKRFDHKNGCPQCKAVKVCLICTGKVHNNPEPEWIKCNTCFRCFWNQDCFNRHLETKACEIIWKCHECNKNIFWKARTPETHQCGERKCLNCKDYFVGEHKCYMQMKPAKGGYCIISSAYPCRGKEGMIGPLMNEKSWCYSCKTYTEKYFTFDFETDQETNTHIPMWCGVKDYHGSQVAEFYNNGESIKNEFCKWLISSEHKGYTCIAHNARGFDAHFIMQYCQENGIKPYTIYRGSKLMSLEIPYLRIKIIDSLNFVQQPLSSFPKTFGFEDIALKGYFPHKFNTKNNQNYVGHIPDPGYYGYNQMKKEEREKFLQWHKEMKKQNYIFNFKDELFKYGWGDVDILSRAVRIIREEFLELQNIDPFQYLTIASVCMAIYRDKYLSSVWARSAHSLINFHFCKLAPKRR